MKEYRGSKEEDEGGGTQRELGSLEFLNQESEPLGTTLVDAHNGFNKMSRLAMLWTVRHRCLAGARFAFNCYRHWAQLLLPQPGEPLVIILSREGFTQGDPISMVLYGITLVPLAEKLRTADPGLLLNFYADDVAFDASARGSAQLLKLLMKRGPDWGYFPEPDKSLFISDTPGQEEAAKREFVKEGLDLNFISGSQYLGANIYPQDQLEAWVKPQVEAWAYGVRVLGKISQRHPQSAYAGLGMSLQLEWQYLQNNVPGVGTLMGPFEDALREKFLPALFGGGISQLSFGSF